METVPYSYMLAPVLIARQTVNSFDIAYYETAVVGWDSRNGSFIVDLITLSIGLSVRRKRGVRSVSYLIFGLSSGVHYARFVTPFYDPVYRCNGSARRVGVLHTVPRSNPPRRVWAGISAGGMRPRAVSSKPRK